MKNLLFQGLANDLRLCPMQPCGTLPSKSSRSLDFCRCCMWCYTWHCVICRTLFLPCMANICLSHNALLSKALDFQSGESVTCLAFLWLWLFQISACHSPGHLFSVTPSGVGTLWWRGQKGWILVVDPLAWNCFGCSFGSYPGVDWTLTFWFFWTMMTLQ